MTRRAVVFSFVAACVLGGTMLAVSHLTSIILVERLFHATKPKLDSDTCVQLRAEEKKFRQSGILNDMSKGPEWAKANLSAARLREVQHYIELDEQVQFGCRDARLSVDALKASAAAERIEINSDADPTIPIVYRVERVRDGGSFTTRRVIAIQHGQAIFSLEASFHVDEDDGLEHQAPMPPDLSLTP